MPLRDFIYLVQLDSTWGPGTPTGSGLFLRLRQSRDFPVITPKAFANLSLGLERSDNPRITTSENHVTLNRVRQLPNPYRVLRDLNFDTQGCRASRSNPGLGLANAFGVILKIHGVVAHRAPTLGSG